MRTIHTLLALSTVACSTSFEDQEQASNQKDPWMESADIEVSLHSPFQDDSEFDATELAEHVSGLETDELMTDAGIDIPDGDDLPAAREAGELEPIVEESFDFNALVAKRDHGSLSLRMWPGRDVQALICFQYDDSPEKCVEDSPTYFGARYGGEITVDFLPEDVVSYSMKVKNSDGQSAEYGPFDMPERENHWQEELSCDSAVKVTDIKHRLTEDEEQDLIVKFKSPSAVSAVMCGMNENGFNVCDWSQETSGNVSLSLPSSSELSPRDFLVIDHQGCSRAYQFEISP